MKTAESFLGATPPISVTANDCRTVTINIKYHFEHREHDTLRKLAAQICREREEPWPPVER